jgi:hypothetical protein
MRRQERIAKTLSSFDLGGGHLLTSLSQRIGPRYQDIVDGQLVSGWASSVLAKHSLNRSAILTDS